MDRFVENDGIARSVLNILLLTTIGCLAYTWGYYEVRSIDMLMLSLLFQCCCVLKYWQGLHNNKIQLLLSHEHESAKYNESAARSPGGHGLLAVRQQPALRQEDVIMSRAAPSSDLEATRSSADGKAAPRRRQRIGGKVNSAAGPVGVHRPALEKGREGSSKHGQHQGHNQGHGVRRRAA